MVTIKDLTFGYKKQELFRDITLDFAPGRIYGFLGRNGAGKTTLFKLICGLLQPQLGACSVFDLPSPSRFPAMLRDIFFIPETFWLPSLTVKKYKDLHQPFYPRFSEDRFNQLLGEYGLPLGKKLNTLSYGQKKKFVLSFGLAAGCRLLLLDEPTNGLDIPSKRQLRQHLASYLEEDRTVIVATHQVKEIENIFDSLVIIDNGAIMLQGTLDEIAGRLLFKTVPSLQDITDCLYSEETPGGYSVITKNDTGQEEKVDIEFLFNAVVNQKGEISRLFHEAGQGGKI